MTVIVKEWMVPWVSLMSLSLLSFVSFVRTLWILAITLFDCAGAAAFTAIFCINFLVRSLLLLALLAFELQ